MFRSLRAARGRASAAWIVLALLLAAAPVLAQEKPPVGTTGMSAEEKAMVDAMVKAGTPGPNHQMLSALAGEWEFKTKMWMNPSAPPTESVGTARYTSIFDGRYLEGVYTGNMMGMPFEGRGLMGYDNVSRQFQTSWADNMGTMIVFMEGGYEPATKTITYVGEMDDMMKPQNKVRVRQVVKLTSPDSHSMEWFETRDGKETKMMEITYTRKR